MLSVDATIIDSLARITPDLRLYAVIPEAVVGRRCHDAVRALVRQPREAIKYMTLKNANCHFPLGLSFVQPR
jgi:hypothetical protein